VVQQRGAAGVVIGGREGAAPRYFIHADTVCRRAAGAIFLCKHAKEQEEDPEGTQAREELICFNKRRCFLCRYWH